MLKLGSLFSGAGGLDLAVGSVFGAETVWHCELDSAASKVLAHRWPGVPNLGSITEVDWAAVEPVDVLCGGFPCQDVSSAGKRAGLQTGTRSGLWAMYAEAIEALRPTYVVIENVRGLLSATAHRPMESESDALGDRDSQPVLRAIGAVLGDLSDLGYDARWQTVAASAVGAPHRRERVFILAYPQGIRWGVGDTTDEWATRGEVNAPRHDRLAIAHAGHAGLSGEADDARRRQSDTAGRDLRVQSDGRGTPSTDPARDGRHEGWPEPTRLVGGSDAPLRSDTDVAFLPTPRAGDGVRGADVEIGGTRPSGAQRSVDLNTIAALLPTPNAQDGNGGGRFNGKPGSGHQNTLPGTVRELLPTPAAADGARGQDYARTNREGSGGDDLVTCLVKAHNLLPTPTVSQGRNETSGRQPGSQHHTGTTLGDVAYANQWGKYGPAIARWEQVNGPAPSPTEPNRNGNPRLNPAFSEWMMGWPAGWVTQVPGLTRNEQLRIVGNGVVPQCAAAALRYLLSLEVAA